MQGSSVIPAEGSCACACIVKAILRPDLRQGQRTGIDDRSGGQRATAKGTVAVHIISNGFQAVRVQCVRVQNFKGGPEPKIRTVAVTINVTPIARAGVPPQRTVRRKGYRRILSP
ncbi:hypothetical protein SDC9_101606 [bioreactor metagenome]|uniref:Uncharacterized protein n=1 Tax=bioreactor metagenome TaxID=1076179 RepID=A0A645AZ83_9ZZZZ